MTWAQSPKIHVLATAKIDDTPSAKGHVGEEVPEIWTYENTLAGGTQPYRAFVWMQGHNYSNFTDPKIAADAAQGDRLGGEEAVRRADDGAPGARRPHRRALNCIRHAVRLAVPGGDAMVGSPGVISLDIRFGSIGVPVLLGTGEEFDRSAIECHSGARSGSRVRGRRRRRRAAVSRRRPSIRRSRNLAGGGLRRSRRANAARPCPCWVKLLKRV